MYLILLRYIHTGTYLTNVRGEVLPNSIPGIFYEYDKAPLFLAIIRKISEIRANKNPIAAQAQNSRTVGKYVRRVTLSPERLRSAPSLSRQRHQPPEELRRAGLVPVWQYFNFILSFKHSINALRLKVFSWKRNNK